MHQWYGIIEAILICGALAGSFTIAILATELKYISRISSALLLITLIGMYVAQTWGGSSMGSKGWVFALIAITTLIPLSLIGSLISASMSLLSLLSEQPKVRFFVFMTLGVWFVISSVLFILLTATPNSDKILSMLDHNDSKKRLNSIHLLSRIRDERAIQPLIRIIENEEEEFYIRDAALWTLKEYLPDTKVIGFILNLNPEGKTPKKEAVLYALGDILGKADEISAKDAYKKLLHYANGEASYTRSIAIDALGASDSPAVIWLFITKLSDKDEGVQFRAYEHLLRKSGQQLKREQHLWQEWFTQEYPDPHLTSE